MTEQPMYKQRFDAKHWAQALMQSATSEEVQWRTHLSELSISQSHFLERECLALFEPQKYHYWFGLYSMVAILAHDPILASQRNPQVWLYALENAGKKHGCRVLHSYWTSVGLMRPQDHFDADLLAHIHGAVQSLVLQLEQEGEPWRASLTPAMAACSEEMALVTVDEDTLVDAMAHHTLQWRDLESIADIPMPWAVSKVLIRVVQMNCFPHRYPEQPLPWPAPSENPSDDWVMAQCIAQRHPHLAHWWTTPKNVAQVPAHLMQGVLALDVGMQLNYLDTFKDWLAQHAPA